MTTDDLPLTQWLVLEVLAARYRAGDPSFTFPNRAKPALRALQALGLADFDSAPIPGNQLARLTAQGQREALFEGYKSTWQQRWEGTEAASRERESLAVWEGRYTVR